MNYNIEKAKKENLDDIYKLQRDYEHILISKEALKNDLENPNSIYFVAKDKNNNIIGCVGSVVLVDHIDISIVITSKKYINQGIASFMLNTLITDAKNQNLSNIFLEVRKSNLPAINLYEKFKFTQISIRKNYYADNKEDALIYMLKI